MDKRSEIEWNEINFRIGFDGEKRRRGRKIITYMCVDKIFKGKRHRIRLICN